MLWHGRHGYRRERNADTNTAAYFHPHAHSDTKGHSYTNPQTYADSHPYTVAGHGRGSRF